MGKNIIDVTTNNFNQEVLKSSMPVVVDFWATWCMPCKMIAPVIEGLSKDYAGKCKFVKLDIDEAMEIATKYQVMNIPTVIFFKNGTEETRMVGMASKENIVKRIDALLS